MGTDGEAGTGAGAALATWLLVRQTMERRERMLGQNSMFALERRRLEYTLDEPIRNHGT